MRKIQLSNSEFFVMENGREASELANTAGSSLKGYLHVTYKSLVSLLGEPTYPKGDEYKVDAEWVITSELGYSLTVYNYKDGKNYMGEEGIPTNDITQWHVGGKDKEKALHFIDSFQKEIQSRPTEIYEAEGAVIGNCWGGGIVIYKARKFEGYTSYEELIDDINKAFKGGSLDSGYGFEALTGAVMLIRKIENIEVNGKEYSRSEVDDKEFGTLSESERDLIDSYFNN